MDDDFINIDLQGAIEEAEERRKAIPKAVYHVRIKSVERKLKEGEGKFPYLDVRMMPLEYPKKTLFLTLSFHPDAIWNMAEFCKKAKIQYSKSGFKFRDLVGKELRVTVDEEPSNEDPNEMRNTVKPPYHAI